jgi:hypothetical protein
MAALNKRWVGSTSDTTWTTITNWAGISLRNSTYRWLLSGSGTANYYLDLAGGGNPGISTPGSTSGAITGNDLAFASGTAGSLAVSQFGYGDADALGYSTIYVRLADGTDPDTKSLDYVKLYQIPVATDHVRIPAGASAITGTDQTAVAIGDFIVEPGYTGAIGSATLPLSIDPDKFEWSGTGTSHIYSIGAIAHDIREAGTGTAGTAGLYLTGTGISTLTVYKGAVGLAMLHGQTATVTTVRVNGSAATVYLGKGVSATTTYVASGALYQYCSATTTNAFGGKLYTEEVGTIGTLNLDGSAQAFLNSTGTITTANMQASYSGTVDMLQSAEPRTITTLNHKAGTIKVDRGIVTITTYAITDSKPQTVAISNAAA